MKPLTVLLSLIALVASCAGDSLPTGEALTYCDITRSACQEGIYRSVAELLGVEAEGPPPVRTISAEEHEAEVYERYEPEKVEVTAWTIASRLMGFIPDGDSTLTETRVQWKLDIWGYYSSKTKLVTIIDRDYEPEDATSLLAHEFVHALQDREFGFDDIWEGVDSEDEWMATRSVIEGDAKLVEWVWYFDAHGFALEPEDWNEVHAENKDWLLERVRESSEPFLHSVSDFPYIYGFEFMTNAFLNGGRAARRSIWENPPRSSSAIMKGYVAFTDGQTEKGLGFSASHPSPVLGYEVYEETELGMWYLYAFLVRHGLDEAHAWDTASSLQRDLFGAYESDSEIASVWRFRFQEPDYSDLVAQALAKATRDVSWQVLERADETFLLAAETQSALASWLEQPLASVAGAATQALTVLRLPVTLSSRSCVEFDRAQ
jgi:hypothetical protein